VRRAGGPLGLSLAPAERAAREERGVLAVSTALAFGPVAAELDGRALGRFGDAR